MKFYYNPLIDQFYGYKVEKMTRNDIFFLKIFVSVEKGMLNVKM